jgi:ABC-type molybdate transport system substrate-binding protein
VNAADVAVFAAGSLRSALTDVAQAFERSSGHKVVLTFGASGLLRDRIRSGEHADVFASANMEHPQALAALGWTERVDRFARNTMCVLARRTMLDPNVRLGTSTPKSDPSGDYAWQVFHKADVMQPGSFATLSAKAMQLTGGPQSPPPPSNRSLYGVLLAENRADIFLTYCTNAELSRKEQPGLKSVKLPSTLEVSADYGMAIAHDAPAPARDFARFVLGPDGQSRLNGNGFDPP